MSDPLLKAIEKRGFYLPTYTDRHGRKRVSQIFWARDPITGRRMTTGARTIEGAIAWKRRREAAVSVVAVPAMNMPGVYIVAAGGYIKVGCSKVSIAKRLKTLQADQPHEVKLLGVASPNPVHERRIKNALRRFRVRGEWFTLTDASMRIVAKLLAGTK